MPRRNPLPLTEDLLLTRTTIKISLITISMVLFFFSTSSFMFDAYAQQQQGGAATSGPATGGAAGSAPCYGNTCNYYGGPATGGSATGGAATGGANTPSSPPKTPVPQHPPPFKTCPTESSTLLPYVNATIGIKMQYPSDWKRVMDVQNNAVRLFSPSDTGNVHIYSALEKQNRTLDQFTQAHIIQEKQKLSGFNSIVSSATTLAGKEAHNLVYTYIDSKGATVKAMEVYTITGNKIYTIAYYSSIATYDCHLPIIQKMINSFALV